MSDLLYTTDLLGDFERLQQQMTTLFGGIPASLRATRAGTFPAINVGSTEDSVEIVAFAPGLDPSSINVSIDKGLLTISGERVQPTDERLADSRVYAQERFMGSFRRAVELPRHADPDNVQARYIDGCLVISVGRSEASRPRTISVQSDGFMN